jgi:hypothetical protein
LPIQAGDIPETLSSKKKIKETIIIKTPTNYKLGIKNFIEWYKIYYKIKH